MILSTFVDVEFLYKFLFIKLSAVAVKFLFNITHERSLVEWSV